MAYALGEEAEADGDLAEAAKWYRTAANANDLDGIAALGVHYLNGDGGVEKDPARGLEMIRRAADRGSMRGLFMLARFYDAGEAGLPKSPQRALEYFTQSANRGYARAAYNLAIIYRAPNNGVVPQDLAAAREWVLKAAKLRYLPAAKLAGMMTEMGQMAGGMTEAADWYYVAGMYGDEFSRQRLGQLVVGAVEMPAATRNAGFLWAGDAASAGKDWGHATLGFMHALGRAPALKSPELAYQHLLVAAKLGNVDAQLRLGLVMARGGRGVPEDRVGALAWILAAQRAGASEDTEDATLHRSLEQRMTAEERADATRRAALLPRR